MKQITSNPEPKYRLAESPYTLVNAGIDTLVVNVRYPGDYALVPDGLLPEPLIVCLNAWKALAVEKEEPIPSPFSFRGNPLFIHEHGVRGQWSWRFTCEQFSMIVARGKFNGVVAQVRFASQFLWSSEDASLQQDIWPLLVEVSDFLSLFFTGGSTLMDLQVSELHLCADLTGWDVSACEWRTDFLSRSRLRVDRADATDIAGGAPVAVLRGRRLATLGFGSHGAALSGCIYDKTLEIKTSGKLWFRDIWKRHGYDGTSDVWRVEMRWKREGLHEFKQDGVFHGIERVEELGLPDRIAYLWAYSVGHVLFGSDALSDGWLRYVIPTDDTNVSRWPVHPAWVVVQSAFCQTEQTVNVTTGEVFEVPASPIGEVIRQRHFEVNVKQLSQQIGGCASTLAAWLGGPETLPQVFAWLMKHLPEYAFPDLAAAVSSGQLHTEYHKLFIQQIAEKQALYGLLPDNA